jgi:predicted  nucleic acid-binding Zn-ribbon protein
MEPAEKIVDTPQPSETDLAMQRAISSLATQIGLLNDEVRKLSRETGRNSEIMELLLNEDRLSKLEDKIQEAADRKAQLDAREQELVRRSRNIQGELVLRGGLRRDEAEAAIRSDIQRGLDDIHTQQAAYQQRAAELVEQSARVRARVETLRKKFESSEEKGVREEK